MFLVLRRPTPGVLAPVVERLRGEQVTYPEVGATEAAATGGAGGEGGLPPGYDHQRATSPVGRGDDDWRAAVDGLRRWQLHRRQGFTVVPEDPPLAAGTTVLSAIPLAPGVTVLAGCRITWAVEEPDRVGFGYGTLPVHPASGEEAFVVTREPAGETAGLVRVTIVAFSRPRHPLVRLGAPVARRQQARAVRGYIDALRAHVVATRGE